MEFISEQTLASMNYFSEQYKNLFNELTNIDVVKQVEKLFYLMIKKNLPVI